MAHLSAVSILQKTIALTIALMACAHAGAADKCKTEWDRSSASGSCTLTYSSLSEDRCTLQTRCKKSSGIVEDMIRSNWHVDAVRHLRNENGRLAGEDFEPDGDDGYDFH